jgi:DNA-binding beta-propeller fold protein YncE
VSARILFFTAALGAMLTSCGPEPTPASTGTEAKPIPGRLTNAVGTGRQGFDGDGHAARESWLNQPSEVGFDADDNLYVVDWNNHRLRQLQDGKLQTVIGARLPGDWPPDVDATEAVPGTELALNHPMDIAFTNSGRAYVAAWHNHKLLELEPKDGSVRRIAGGSRPGYAGDGGTGQAALLNFPGSIVLDASGALLLADQRNNVIRRVANDDEHTITTVAGVKAPSGYKGDDGPATTAALGMCPYDEAGGSDNPPPGGALALDADGNLYLADTFNHCVRRVLAGDDGLVGAGDPAQEVIETFAGECGTPGFAPDIEPSSLLLDTPRDLEVHDGGLYIADSGNSVVWRVELDTGKATRVVGTGEAGEAPNDSLPLEAPLHQPYGIGFDSAGNLYIADTLSNRVLVLGSENQ